MDRPIVYQEEPFIFPKRLNNEETDVLIFINNDVSAVSFMKNGEVWIPNN